MAAGYPPGPGKSPGGSEPDWRHIADALWLAATMEGPGEPTGRMSPGHVDVPPVAVPERGDGGGPETGGSPPRPPLPAGRQRDAARPAGPAFTAGSAEIEDTGDPSPLTALPAGRLLARALKPFQRRVESATEVEPDEEETANFAVDTGVWLPRYRPVQDRWLGLTLIVDDSPSMAVWRPTVAAFRILLERHGAFRGVRTFLLSDRDGDGHQPRLRGPTGGVRSPAELLDPARRQIFLVLSDGISALWRAPAVGRLLRLWGTSGPLAIVNPLPRGHWRQSNIAPLRFRIRAPRPAAPNTALKVGRSSPLDPALPPGAFAVPVVELSPRWLRWWATLVTGPSEWVDALVHPVDPRLEPDEDEPPPAGANAAVRRFQRIASPLAFRLATLLAAAPLELPLLHRLQRTLLPESTPADLAELLVSDLVHRTDETGTVLEFELDVRETLLGCATREDSARVLHAIAAHQRQPHAGGLMLARALSAPDAPWEPLVTRETLATARIELAVLNALSGPYVNRARRLRDAIDALEQGQERDADGPAVVAAAEPHPDHAVKDGETMPGHADLPPPPEDKPAESSITRPETPGVPGEPILPVDSTLEALHELFGGQSAESGPKIWGNVPIRNPIFTGRRLLLEQLERRLRTQSVAAVLPQALHGEGGVGKSQIAIEYAYRHRDEYDLIWWVPSELPAQILASLIELGNKLGLDIGNEVTTAIPRVRAALRAGTPYDNWLLVFDNAETPETVRDYFPESGTGKVLITSRNQEWNHYAESLEVDVFTRQESIVLLQRRNPDLEDPDADRLAQALADLPLAIEHASAWLFATGMSVQEYLRLLDEKQAQLAVPDLAPGFEIPVAAAANVALDRLAAENPAALQLLQVCSFFAPEPIDRYLFEGVRGIGTDVAADLDAALQDPARLSQAIRDIQRYVLARIDHRTNTLQLHRLVRRVLQDSIPADRRFAMEHIAHILLASGKLGDPSDSEQWLLYQSLASHLTASKALNCEDDWARALVLKLIEYFFYWGDYASGRDLADEVLTDWRERLGHGYSQTLKAAKWLGYYAWIDGDFPTAERIWRETLDTYRENAGPNDEDTIDAMNMMGIALRTSGQFSDARDLDLEAFQRARRSLGEDDPATLKAAHNLGVSLRLTGEFRSAREIDADTYQRRVAALGSDSPETLRTLNNLTIDQRECGEYVRSRQWVERIYDQYLNLFGVDHLETIRVARNLAVARRRAGDHEKAYKLAEDTMTRFRDRFGANHPDAIAATLDFAVDVRETGELGRALSLAIETIDAYTASLGSEHPYALSARTNLGIVHRLMGNTEDALAQNRLAWRTLTEKLGPDHMLTITCGINFASALAARGDHQAAHDLDARMLEQARRFIGAEHPSTLGCALNLGFDLAALGREEESRTLFDETVSAYVRVLGAEHPAIAAATDQARANCDVDPMQF
ncbi:FxSxx-COOH system tetratricopeptide repeat protein [Actinoplanes sp. NBRC 103695]|uniref:FxSxx-COOH system tetratricopeptide repeat protein n=1 Tax=Actinoplanes sp. NBRC 103695 TaxID=3032202 RepID=UPI0024A02D5F|nr:FxSxx-COOH system tetratricopeptide repeat protein [Actinoplanes sp. NBRC 103695]GLY99090.1 cytochrome c [Actinoplanes sp. NBRC 103695]